MPWVLPCTAELVVEGMGSGPLRGEPFPGVAGAQQIPTGLPELPHRWARSVASHRWEPGPTGLYFFIKVKFTRPRINYLEVKAPVACGTVMILCNRHLCLVPGHLHPPHPDGHPVPLSSHSPAPSAAPDNHQPACWLCGLLILDISQTREPTPWGLLCPASPLAQQRILRIA